MLNNIVIGKYYDINSLIHKMNSFIKLLCTIIFVILTFISYDIKINLIIFIFAILLILISNIPIKFYFKSIFSIKWFLLFIFIINLIFCKDIYISFIICFRIAVTLIYSSMILYTTKHDDLVNGLQILFKPLTIFKIPINKMAHSIALSLNFIPIFIEQYNKVTKLQINRGIYFKKLNFKNKLEVLGSTIISMFLLGIKKSDLLSDSMEVRLFDFNKYEKLNFKLCYFDIFIVIIHISLLFLSFKESVFI